MLSLRLLGAPELLLDGVSKSDSLLSKELALFYYLAVTGQPQPRTSLSLLLWGDLSDTASRGNLRKSLSALHHALGSCIDIRRETVGIVTAQCSVDAWEFEQLVQEGLITSSPQQLQAAVDLYKGELLAGFVVRNAPDFELWLGQMQVRLRELAVRALSALVLHYDRAGRAMDAITCLKRVLLLEPWNEEAHCSLMQLLAASGQRGAALLQYQCCVDSLAAELGVEPTANTRELYERIRDDRLSPHVTPPAPPPSSLSSTSEAHVHGLNSLLPSELTPIVGRERELGELTEMLAAPDCRLISIVGPGGIGKTRLALALARCHREHYDLIGIVPVVAIERAVDLRPAMEGALQAAWTQADDGIDHRQPLIGRTLLIIDGFEHLIPDGIPAIETLLTEYPKLTCVVTSREALDAPWEWRYDLKELSYPESFDDNTHHSEYGAIQLFLQIARRTRPRQAIAHTEMSQVVRICQLVGGMPLGIEFAAAQVGRVPLSLIADQVETRLETLEDTLHEPTGRQRSLRATFEASWRTLASEEQRVLTALSVLRGEFTLDAALFIAGATIPNILRLTDKSLLRLNIADRYSLHEVIRRLAEQRLSDLPEGQESVLQRYRAYYIGLAEGNASAIFARAGATPDPLGYLRNLMQHLRIIWRQTADPTAAENAAIAMNEVQLALSGSHIRLAVDTMDLMEMAQSAATSDRMQQQDVVLYDLVWLPALKDEICDLSSAFEDEQSQLLPILAEMCRFDNRLVAFPYLLDLGLLYYRRDLLEKYGFATPPRTWDQLERIAAEIQHQERASGRPDFWGFVWQGHVSERLTCNAIEWQCSEGGGAIIESCGAISINNCRVKTALERARGWIGAISPPDIRTFDESKTTRVWIARNAAFMRVWAPPIYWWADPISIMEDAKITDITGVTLLPCGAARHAATLGGWPLAVRKGNRDMESAVKMMKTVASFEAQRERALKKDIYPSNDPHLPTIAALYDDPEIRARHPLFGEVQFLMQHDGFAVRPSKVAGNLYPNVSKAYASAVAAILYDGADAAETLAALEQQLVTLGGWPVAHVTVEDTPCPRLLDS